MSLSTELGQDFVQILKHGDRVRFRYFNRTYPGGGSYYDDDLTLTQSGTDLYVSGIVFPLDHTDGSTDQILLAQGRIVNDDRRLYIAGSIQTSGLWRVGIGSPPAREYAQIENGTFIWPIEGTNIYKKIYIRNLPTGSLAEE